VSVIEPVSRAPLSGEYVDLEPGILAAARELGGLGADLYKSEVPTYGAGTDDAIDRAASSPTPSTDLG